MNNTKMQPNWQKDYKGENGNEQLWYQNAIFYLLDVAIYQDSDGDGIGDLQGLTARLPYLADLGITCLWLMPFFPSLDRDDGYDVTDYLNVAKGMGTLDDFRELARQAHERGIRVIIDLVANHTSDQHPWFQDALNDPLSKFRNYYVWSKEKPKEMAPMVIFPGEQKANWTYHPEAKAYYWHYYYDFQPDLNYSNPEVRKEIQEIIEFWMSYGIDGFRLDSLPMMISQKGLPETEPKHPHQLLKYLVAAMKMHDPDAIFLAEANVEPDKLPIYFGDDDEMNLLYNFYANSYFFLAIVRQEAETLRRAWKKYPDVLSIGHWLNFMRSHDELSIERLTKKEQKEVFDALAPDKDWRIYERGIRCRLPRVLGDDRRKLELAYSYAFSLPGAALLLYGEEIGMGDNLDLPGRLSSRTPMQWSAEKNGGFSEADSAKLVRPVTSTGKYSYRKINVASQKDDSDSFLSWMKRLIKTRKEYPLFGTGEFELWEPDNPAVFALHFYQEVDGKQRQMLTLHNFSNKATTVELDGEADQKSDPESDQEPGKEESAGDWQLVWSDARSPAYKKRSTTIKLAPFGYRWLCRESKQK